MDVETYYSYLTQRSRFSFFVRQFYVRSISQNFKGRVLDVGCGIGEFLEYYPHSVGVDLNPLLVRYCQDKGALCSVSGAYRLPFGDETFDGVLISHVLEHLPEWKTAVKEAARVLKPEGAFVIAVPMTAGFRHDATHVSLIQAREVHEITQQFPLRLKKIQYFPFGVKWPGQYLYFCELRAVFKKRTP